MSTASRAVAILLALRLLDLSFVIDLSDDPERRTPGILVV